jgi:hypothetical protein
MNERSGILRCECGREIAAPPSESGDHIEHACECGRRHDLARAANGWGCAAELNPEGSLPLSGFSRELRAAPDAERFWFRHSLAGEVPLPVHVLVSRSAARAEVKSGAQKVFAIDHAVTPTEARRLWISWWHARPRTGRPGRVCVPSRIGRWPEPPSPRA